MQSLKKRVSTYFRQLSFHNEPRSAPKHNLNENAFINRYLQGKVALNEGPQIFSGHTPNELPNYELVDSYLEGADARIVGCLTGPDGGLTSVQRIEKHLNLDALIDDIDYIDNTLSSSNLALSQKDENKEQGEEGPEDLARNSKKQLMVDNATMVIKVAGQEYCVTNKTRRRVRRHSKSHSMDSVLIDDDKIDLVIERTRRSQPPEIPKKTNDNNNNASVNKKIHTNPDGESDRKVLEVVASASTKSGDSTKVVQGKDASASGQTSNKLAKSKSEGDPFRHGKKKRGKVIKVTRSGGGGAEGGGDVRDGGRCDVTTQINSTGAQIQRATSSSNNWNHKSDTCYGISGSLYDRNQATKLRNGDPIADCFGIIAREDSAILAVADGVNWGERASVAAKSAIHGSLHYLNRTIFNDQTIFPVNSVKNDDNTSSSESAKSIKSVDSSAIITNTTDIFVALLRAFNCAHDLILANNGLLTTLTVAVIIPKNSTKTNSQSNKVRRKYACCVCNVGDSLAYVYSPENGGTIRELTKGSHNVQQNRDIRDALGALGPVDGINPELSNLTLSVTEVESGDIVFVASDGLTDNFDPNVCRFTANQPNVAVRNENTPNLVQNQNSGRHENQGGGGGGHVQVKRTPPIKPPRSDIQHKKKETTIENKRRTTPPPPSTTSTKQQAHIMYRSKTSVEFRSKKSSALSKNVPTSSNNHPLLPPLRILRNPEGLPYVTPVQRYELQLLLISDILKTGLKSPNGNLNVTTSRRVGVTSEGAKMMESGKCSTARELCTTLYDFTQSVTSAKRRTLEDPDLYYDTTVGGVLVEVALQERRARLKRARERIQGLPGKLDHVTVVAWNVGNFIVGG